MKNRLLSAILCLMLCIVPTLACAETTGINVACLQGPTAMGMVELMRDKSDTYTFTVAGAADEITPALVQGTLDIAAVPANLASVLYNNTNGAVKVLAINTLGVLYIVERGTSVNSVQDLRGRTVYSAGKGATPEYALNYILTQNGLDPEKDLTIEYKSEHSECLAALLQDDTAVAMLPQPFATVAQSKAEDMRIALDLNAEWETLQAGSDTPSALITGVVVARAAFVDEQPDAAKQFLADYEASVAFTLENQSEAAALIGEYGIFDAAIAEKALPYCNITFIAGNDMKDKLSGYLAALYAQNPAAVGGAMPDDSFYFIAD